jgi:hypothetical protein
LQHAEPTSEPTSAAWSAACRAVPSLARCPLTGVCDAAAAGRSWAMELRLVAYKHERGSL